MTSLPVLEASAVTKRFPGVLANDNVDFKLLRGEVHTLLGENGAGKSTLAAMLCGLYRPDDGQILLDGVPIELNSPRDGLAYGIGMIYQHCRLVESFSIAENIILGRPGDSLLLDHNEINQTVAEISKEFGLPIDDPTAPVSTLTVGQRQRVEIIKVLHRGAEVMLLDEPTAVLTPPEVEGLFNTVRKMTKAGKSVVFISHKLNEIMQISDRVTVMRAGRVAGTVETTETSTPELTKLMVGQALPGKKKIDRSQTTDKVVLKATGLVVLEDGQRLLDGVDIELRAGEIVGVAGVSGNGQGPLATVLAGMTHPERGTVQIAGQNMTGKGPRKVRQAGLVFVPEDRLGTGLVPALSLTDNMLLTGNRRFFLRRRIARKETKKAIERFGIKTPGTETDAGSLSGGNAQKLLLARELAAVGSTTGPKVLVVANPTHGLDVAAATFVRDLLIQARSEGVAVLLISEDLDEIIELCDRVAVMYQGRIVFTDQMKKRDSVKIGAAMAGVV